MSKRVEGDSAFDHIAISAGRDLKYILARDDKFGSNLPYRILGELAVWCETGGPTFRKWMEIQRQKGIRKNP